MSSSLARRILLFLLVRVLDTTPHTNLKFVALLYLLIPSLCITGDLCYSHFIDGAALCTEEILSYTFCINGSGIVIGHEVSKLQ